MRTVRVNNKGMTFMAIVVLVTMLVAIVVVILLPKQLLGGGKRIATQTGCFTFLEVNKNAEFYVTQNKLIFTKERERVSLPCGTVQKTIRPRGNDQEKQTQAAKSLKKAMEDCFVAYKVGGEAFNLKKGNVCIACSQQEVIGLKSVTGLDTELANAQVGGYAPSRYTTLQTDKKIAVVAVLANAPSDFAPGFGLRGNIGIILEQSTQPVLDSLNCALLQGDPLVVKKTR